MQRRRACRQKLGCGKSTESHSDLVAGKAESHSLQDKKARRGTAERAAGSEAETGPSGASVPERRWSEPAAGACSEKQVAPLLWISTSSQPLGALISPRLPVFRRLRFLARLSSHGGAMSPPRVGVGLNSIRLAATQSPVV